jgi:hypothetical protein
MIALRDRNAEKPKFLIFWLALPTGSLCDQT